MKTIHERKEVESSGGIDYERREAFLRRERGEPVEVDGTTVDEDYLLVNTIRPISGSRSPGVTVVWPADSRGAVASGFPCFKRWPAAHHETIIDLSEWYDDGY